MKKALVATCVVAMTVVTITNASADPVGSARANAFGLFVGGSLADLVEREPEVTSVFPPGGLVSEDIITPDVQPVTIAGTGVVVAQTAGDSTIVPFLGSGEGGTTGGATTGGGGGGEALLGGIFDDLLGGGGGGGLGVLSEDADGGDVAAQQLDGLTGGGGEGLLGGTLGGDLLGGLLDGGDEGDQVGADDEIVIPAVNASGFARIEDLNLVVEDDTLLSDLSVEVQALLVDALLEIDTVTAEAVAVCVDDQVFFDTASNIVALNDEPVTLIDDLLGTVSDLTEDLGLLEVVTNEVGVTDDGTGVFVNALHITLLDDLLGGDTLGGTTGDTLGGTTGDTLGGTTGDTLGVSAGSAGQVEAQQLGDGGDEPLLDIIIGHAEVSAVSCAAPPATTTTLTPTGDARPSLPATGGGLGALPVVVGVGLLGGALTAGRLALRSRRTDIL